MKIAATIGYMYPFVSTPAEAVKAHVNTGFRYLDYNFYTAHIREKSPYLEESDRFWKEEVENAARAAEEGGFTFVQAHTPGYNPLGPGDHALSMKVVHRTIEACGMLKIPYAVIHTGFSLEYRYPGDKEGYFERNRQFLAPLLETAEKNNVTLCFENSTSGNMGDRYFFRTPEEMNEFAAFMGNHPHLKCCWDVGHALMEGHRDQYDDLMKLKENLRTVHIHDNDGVSDLHLAPYCGKLLLDSVVRALKDMHFSGYFTFETDSFMNHTNGNGPLRKMPMELYQETLRLLYKIGRYALETYGIFEE